MGLNFLGNLSKIIPELVIVTAMIGMLFIEATGLKSSSQKRGYIFSIGVIGLVICLFSLVKNMGLPGEMIFTDAMTFDPFGTGMKIIMCFGSLGAIYLGRVSRDIPDILKNEFIILSFGVLVGGMLLVSASNFLIVYLGVETLSILSYVMACLKKSDEKSSEAGIKYVLYGGITSGIMLFGMSHIYGTLGTIYFSEVLAILGELNRTQMLVLLPSFVLVFAGLGYKIACVPFHMWSPDVYEGSPLPVTAFFSIVPKIAGIAALIRVTHVFFGEPSLISGAWVALLQIVSALTMTLGNILAIDQKSVKRMLAYSSISHVGFILIGILLLDSVGTTAVLFYGFTYLFMVLTAFGILSFLSDHFGTDRFEIFNGLLKSRPVMSVVMIIILCSLAGIPPFAGFVAKYNILIAAFQGRFYILAVIAVLNSVISLYYYLRIIRLMVFKKSTSEGEVGNFTFINQMVIVCFCFPIVLFGLFWEKAISLARGAFLFLA